MHQSLFTGGMRGAAAHSGERSERRQTMSPILPITPIVLMMILHVRAESLAVIVDDPVQFPVNCPMNETAALHREDGTGNPPLVAARRDGVCTPDGGFTDRLDLNSCFAFSRSRYTDSGLYEFICGSATDRIQLDVVVASDSSVSEGEAVKLGCYYNTAGGQVEVLRWEKNGDMVLEKKLSTGELRYGPGFEGRVRTGATGGDWSLMWDHAQLQDEGDYFCSLRSEGARKERGDPAAARLKVHKKHLVPTTLHPPLNGTAGERMDTWIIVVITAAVTSAFWALCFFVVWCLKLRTPSGQDVSPGPDGGRPQRDLEMGLLPNGNSAGPQTNGGPEVPHLIQ